MGIKTRIKNYLLRRLGPFPVRYVKADVTYISEAAKLRGKRVVITGGGRGLGRAMAARFAAEGAEVLIAGRNQAMLKEQAEELGCQYEVLDIRLSESRETFWKNVYEKMGEVDILVNNAGVSLHELSMLTVSEAQYDEQFDTNLKGAYFLTQAFIEHHVNSNKAASSILFVSSERGQTVDTLPYGLTKAAINSLVQGLAYRYARSGIRVNGIAPGVTASDMTGFKVDGNLDCSYNITERVYLPEEVAEIACFLVSDAARILNGQILVCNEGKTINIVR